MSQVSRVSLSLAPDEAASERARAVSLQVVEAGLDDDDDEPEEAVREVAVPPAETATATATLPAPAPANVEPTVPRKKPIHNIRMSIYADADVNAPVVEETQKAYAREAEEESAPVESTPAVEPTEPTEPKAPPPASSRRGLAYCVLLLAAAAYFRDLEAPPEHVYRRGRLWSPKVASKMEILSARPTSAKWKRDGGFHVEATVKMRMFNPAPLPLKVKTLNMTALMRSIGADTLYAAGYKTALDFRVPPLSHKQGRKRGFHVPSNSRVSERSNRVRRTIRQTSQEPREER